jgi:ComF family protein
MGLFDFLKRDKSMTPDQKVLLREQKKERKKLARQLKREANTYAGIVKRRLTKMGLCYRYRLKENDIWEKGLQQIQFLSPLKASPEAIYLPIDTMRLPRGLRKDDLLKDEVIADLSVNCRRQVYAVDRVATGFWYVVERMVGIRGIPTHVAYADMLTLMPEKASSLTFPVGMGENSRAVFASVDDFPHCIVAGATDQGKSVFINNIICTLAQRNAPSELQMYMVDLKGGVELSMFDGLPHLGKPIIKKEPEVIEIIQELLDETTRRMAMFEGHCRNIREWNHGNRQKGRLPNILFVVDELANLMLCKDSYSDGKKTTIANIAENKLAKLAATSRAAGIYCIVATQRPSVDVVTGIIKANFPVRFAFSTASQTDSRVIIDVSEAYGLSPQGRMIYAHGKQHDEIQGPYVSTNMVKKIVSDLKAGRGVEKITLRHDVTEEEIFEYALDVLKGDFTIKKLYQAFKERGVISVEIEEMGKRFEGQIVQVRGEDYRLEPGAGSKPRRLVSCVLCPEISQAPPEASLDASPTDMPLDIELAPPITDEAEHAANLDWIGAACWYQEPLVQAIQNWKYRGDDGHLPEMTAYLTDYWEQQGLALDMIIPVPLHPEVQAKRGFNQAEVLAQALSTMINTPCITVLERTRNTPPQYQVKRRDMRTNNVQGAFALLPETSVEGLRVLIIDDIVSTGATVGECGRVLREAGATWVGALTLARPKHKKKR